MAHFEQDDFIFCPSFSVELPPDISQPLELWAMVFRQGVVDYAETMRYENGMPQGRHTCLAEDRVEIKAWFASDEVYPGSFVWLCHLFNRDVSATRRVMTQNWETLHLPMSRAKKRVVEDDLEEFA